MIAAADAIIASKLPPKRTQRTYFHSGRAAFAFLIGQVVRPRRVYLPSYTCWSLVSTMERRFPELQLSFYSVRQDLSCEFPCEIFADETLVFMHYFGYQQMQRRPPGLGCVLEDVSHSFLADFPPQGDHVFGSLRKAARVGDGGFVAAPFNPQYEPSDKLDTWLRYEATDWRDMREAENMIDRDWQIADISSQSLAVILQLDREHARQTRLRNEKLLFTHLRAGTPLRRFQDHEAPLLHQRMFDSTQERDELRKFLASRNIFCSIHWPTHPRVLQADIDLEDTIRLERHSLAIPVSHEYDLPAMERIIDATESWVRAGS